MQPLILRYARQLLNLSQQELAEAVGISQSMIAKIESGSVPMQEHTKQKILQMLDEEGFHTENLMILDWLVSEIKAGKLKG